MTKIKVNKNHKIEKKYNFSVFQKIIKLKSQNNNKTEFKIFLGEYNKKIQENKIVY